MPDAAYTLADLCDLADVTPRTVRYYISQGLLRSPGTSGPGARYDDGHLARLRLIRRLQREHLPLAEIRSRLAALTDDEAIAQAEGPGPEPVGSALDYVRGVLASPFGKPSAGAGPGGRAVPIPPSAGSPGRGAAPSPSPHVDAPWPPQARLIPDAPPHALLRRAAEAPADLAAPEPPPPDRSQWERYAIAPDVELHVRRPLTRSQNRAVARLLEAARQILEEDQP
jgi:DNA-binding transcriptional MerR regulator